MTPWTIHEGDALTVLRTLPDASVQCCVTSPPYWGLRDYGTTGQLGLEPTPERYVAALVAVFREVRRVLRDDGTLWLNLGDSYAGSSMSGGIGNGTLAGTQQGERKGGDLRFDGTRALAGLKAKDLVGIPWRVAFALQADGWWLRSDIIWSKSNPMPESITDRPTKAHEYLFLLAKSATYYFDQEAVRERYQYGRDRRSEYTSEMQARQRAPESQATPRRSGNRERSYEYNGGRYGVGHGVPWEDDGRGRNLRSVWTIATEPYAEAHFATFPPDLVVPCIKAGSRAGGLVLDPFAGAGTTGLVAHRLGRAFVGIELSATYAAMARRRITDDCPLFAAAAPAANPVTLDLFVPAVDA